MVQDKDIFFYGAAVMPEDDADLNIGGAIDTSIKVTFSQHAVSEVLRVVSEAAGDTTQDVTLYGRNAAGEKVNEAVSLNGQTPASGALSFERLLKAVKSASTTGVVGVIATTQVHSGTAQAGGADTIQLAAGASGTDNQYRFMVIRTTGGTGANQIREILSYDGTSKQAKVRDWTVQPDATTTYEICEGMVFEQSPTEIMTVMRPIPDIAAEAEGGSERKYYTKIFVANNNATKALTNATIAEEAAGLFANIAFALEDALDDTGTNGAGNNRLVAPASGTTAFDSNEKNVPNSQNFSPQSALGVWLEVTLAAGAAAANSFYQIRVKGQST